MDDLLGGLDPNRFGQGLEIATYLLFIKFNIFKGENYRKTFMKL